MGVSLSVTAIGARMGDLTMAVNTIMLQFFLFFSYFMDGFSFAGEALIFDGFFIGLTATRRMCVTTLIAILTFGAIISLGFINHSFDDKSAGNMILWTAFLSFLGVRGVGLAIQFPRIIHNMEKTKKLTTFA